MKEMGPHPMDTAVSPVDTSGADRGPAKIRSQKPHCGRALLIYLFRLLSFLGDVPTPPEVMPTVPVLFATLVDRVPPHKGSFWWYWACCYSDLYNHP